MKRKLTKAALFITLCFSLFCFGYLNIQSDKHIVQSSTTQFVSPEVQPEQNNDEMFLPDLALIEKIASLVKSVSKVF